MTLRRSEESTRGWFCYRGDNQPDYLTLVLELWLEANWLQMQWSFLAEKKWLFL